MKNKVVILLVIILLIPMTLWTGCNTEKEDDEKEDDTDVMSTASIVNDKEGFLEAISKDGTWIIIALKDFSFTEELSLEGDFTHNDKLERKIALYAQDEERKVTDTYTLEAPKLTVKSENARIQGGTFIGDIYVDAKDFSIVNATVDGNVYFSSEEFQSSFKLEDGGSITGETKVKKED